MVSTMLNKAVAMAALANLSHAVEDHLLGVSCSPVDRGDLVQEQLHSWV